MSGKIKDSDFAGILKKIVDKLPEDMVTAKTKELQKPNAHLNFDDNFKLNEFVFIGLEVNRQNYLYTRNFPEYDPRIILTLRVKDADGFHTKKKPRIYKVREDKSFNLKRIVEVIKSHTDYGKREFNERLARRQNDESHFEDLRNRLYDELGFDRDFVTVSVFRHNRHLEETDSIFYRVTFATEELAEKKKKNRCRVVSTEYRLGIDIIHDRIKNIFKFDLHGRVDGDISVLYQVFEAIKILDDLTATTNKPFSFRETHNRV